MSRKHGRTIEGYEKDQKALELRKEGHSYESISEQLGYSTRSASYKAVMRRLRDMDRPAVSMLRELEVQRLDAMLYAVWNDVLQGDAGAVSTALKSSERRSRLLGLDAPPYCRGQDKDRRAFVEPSHTGLHRDSQRGLRGRSE